MVEHTFDVKSKDLAGRIGVLTINGKKVETPALMPVINPTTPLLSAKELNDIFDMNVLMTNSYILLKHEQLKTRVLEDGVHKLLDFDGIIATDSGSYQLMNYGAVETNNKDIIKFQEDIGSDIGSFLDIPMMPDAYKMRAKAQLDETLKRSVEAEDAGFLVNAGIQGSKYLDLRKEAALSIGERFPLVAVGGIVPFMEAYRFAELVDIIATSKQNIPSDRVVHAFGLGHPMLFSLAVALGCDLFDSASYALFAKDGRYMTVEGTKRLDELNYISCSCPICSEYGKSLKNLRGDDRVRALSLHNLHICFNEIEMVKQSIKDGRLWEHVALRCRGHPAMMGALRSLCNHGEWISEIDSITKKSALYYTGFEMEKRPEVINARKRLENVSTSLKIPLQPFGEVPTALMDLFPFGQTLHPDNLDELTYKVSDLDKVRAIAEYQFGVGAGELIPERVRIKKSRKTKRMRWVYLDRELFISIRASDHFLLPKEKFAELLHENFEFPKLRVVMKNDEETIACVREGKSVFSKFVKQVDEDLRCGDECLVVDEDDNLVRTGTLHMSPTEIMDFTRGMAVRVR